MSLNPNSMESSSSPLPFPRLAIRHVLLWMACSCVVGGWKSSSYSLPSGSWSVQAHQLMSALTYNMLAGLSLAGLVMAIGCAVRGQRYYPRTAGHWLLTTSGLVMICSEASNWITDTWHHAHPEWSQTDVSDHVTAYSFAVIAAIYLIAAIVVRDWVAWRFVFVGHVATPLYWSIANFINAYGNDDMGYQLDQFGYRFQWPLQLVMAFAVAILGGFDLYRHRHRDWLHWTGVIHAVTWPITQTLLVAIHGWITK